MSDLQKQQAALAALDFVQSDWVIGVGTGSTVNFFIDALGKIKGRLEGVVSSSEASTVRLKKLGIPVYDLNGVGPLPLYVDGADEADTLRRLIKGGGGALTREKIIAAASEQFICIVDKSKCVPLLGAFPLPIEVLPMARSYVARALVKRGGQPVWRENFKTDNGGLILDVHHLDLSKPEIVEAEINQLAGVVSVGLFAQRPADKVLVGSAGGVDEY